MQELADKKKASIYLKVALEEYNKHGNSEAFLLTLRHIAQAHGGLSKLAKKQS